MTLVKGRLVRTGVAGCTGFTPTQTFSTFEGQFDQVLARVRFLAAGSSQDRVVAARIGNIILFGLDHNIPRRRLREQNATVRDALLSTLASVLARD